MKKILFIGLMLVGFSSFSQEDPLASKHLLSGNLKYHELFWKELNFNLTGTNYDECILIYESGGDISIAVLDFSKEWESVNLIELSCLDEFYNFYLAYCLTNLSEVESTDGAKWFYNQQDELYVSFTNGNDSFNTITLIPE